MSGIRRMGLRFWRLLRRWFDSHEETGLASDKDGHHMDRVRTIPFVALHVGVFTVFWVGWSPVAVIAAVVLYVVRMLFLAPIFSNLPMDATRVRVHWGHGCATRSFVVGGQSPYSSFAF